MLTRTTLLIAAAGLLVLAGTSIDRPLLAAGKPERLSFNRDIRPILSEHCYACHGPDGNKRKAKLRLDERESAVSSKAVVPGKPDDSELIARIVSDDSEQVMPPPASHKPLTAAQKGLLRRWIAEGGEYQAHWAYVPLQRPSVPPVRKGSWVSNPIDAFILAGLEARGIAPSPEADRATLIRRLSLDLIGLPPTPEEVRDFEHDAAPRAYERLVDRLLESPHYGERMAVPWLDMVRFADTVGYHGDQGQRIFPYRDYVIDAFNRNLPFDRFTTEQLAGDLLPNPTPEQLVATGFNRLNMMTREGGAQPGEYLAKYAGDRVRTVAVTWLGSTLGCAECHDHKYDPFTMRDFYSLAAFFADVKQWGVYQDYDYTPNPELRGWSNDHPFPPEIQVESRYLKHRRTQLQQRIRKATQTAADRTLAEPGGKAAMERWLAQAAEFVKANPSGWTSPAIVEANGARPQTDGSTVLASPEVPGDWKVVLQPGAEAVARIRIELLPHPAHGGKIARDGAASTTIGLAAEAGPRDGPTRGLSFFLADADHKSPRYFNGDEVPGILDGWTTDGSQPDRPHTAVWALDSPLEFKAEDVLTLRLSGRPGCVRISVSPFGVDPASRPALARDQRAALTAAHRTPEQRAAVEELYVLSQGARTPAWGAIKSDCGKLLACGDGRVFTMVTKAVPPMVTRVLPRGNWQDQSGPVVEPAVPGFLDRPAEAGASGRRLNRLDLARWLTAPENPLTARVFMNRLWKQHFGTGISGLVEDVGAQGEWPVHPELLDWLACEFRDGGWDVKRMVKILVTSSTYRQSSKGRPELRELDPGNRLVAAQSPRRLEAEFVRDNALSIAGLLNLDVGGPSAFPYQPSGYYTNLQFPDRDYIADADDRQYRRGVYTHWQRTFLHPMLANFDAPPREECTAARNLANTPQQALTVLNDPTFVEAARVLAETVLKPGGSDAERLDQLYHRALGRPPRENERRSLLEYVATQRAFFGSHASDAGQLLRVDLAPIPAGVNEPELAAWTMTCRVLLGLHETMTRY